MRQWPSVARAAWQHSSPTPSATTISSRALAVSARLRKAAFASCRRRSGISGRCGDFRPSDGAPASAPGSVRPPWSCGSGPECRCRRKGQRHHRTDARYRRQPPADRIIADDRQKFAVKRGKILAQLAARLEQRFDDFGQIGHPFGGASGSSAS